MNDDVARLKETLAAQPKGRRGIIPNPTGDNILDTMYNSAEHSLWWDNGVNALAVILTKYASQAKSIGAEIDYIAGDYERGLSNWHIGTEDAAWPKYEEIFADPRFNKEILPMLIKSGFVMPDDPNVNPLYSVCYCETEAIMKSKYKENYTIFNFAMHYRFDKYMNKAIFEPFKNSFPNIKFTNCGIEVHEKFDYRDINGHRLIRQTVDPDFYFLGTGIGGEVYGWHRRIKSRPPKFYPYKEYSSSYL